MLLIIIPLLVSDVCAPSLPLTSCHVVSLSPALPPSLKCQNFKRFEQSGSNPWPQSLKFGNLTNRPWCHAALRGKESWVIINKSRECSHGQIESWIEIIVTFLIIFLKRHNSETNRRIGLIFCTVTSHDLFYYCIKFQEFFRSKTTPTSLPA